MRKLDPELQGAIEELIALTHEHKVATWEFLAHQEELEKAQALERAHYAVADAGLEVARVAKALGIGAGYCDEKWETLQ